MNEFLPSKREADATKKKIEEIQSEVNDLEKLTSIGKLLIDDKLKGMNDELEEHLVPQLDRIMESQNLPNIKKARELVVIGYEIDTSLEQGIGINETLLGTLEPLTELVRDLLRDEFPDVTEEEAELVIRRSMDNHKEGYFLDTLLNMIEMRRNKMRELRDNK